MIKQNELEKISHLLSLVSDKRRLEILCHLFEHEGRCVSDISLSVNEPVANTSHHLRALAQAGLVHSTRNGKMICYSIVRNDFTKQFKKLLCNLTP